MCLYVRQCLRCHEHRDIGNSLLAYSFCWNNTLKRHQFSIVANKCHRRCSYSWRYVEMLVENFQCNWIIFHLNIHIRVKLVPPEITLLRFHFRSSNISWANSLRNNFTDGSISEPVLTNGFDAAWWYWVFIGHKNKFFICPAKSVVVYCGQSWTKFSRFSNFARFLANSE